MTRHFSLANTAADRLESARTSSDGRSSTSLHEGEPCVLRQTVTGLLAGHHMEIEHPPDEAWVLVLVGRISVHVDAQEHQTHPSLAGDLIQLPPVPHTLLADEDSVILLTVAKGDRPTHAQEAEHVRVAAVLSDEVQPLTGNPDVTVQHTAGGGVS